MHRFVSAFTALLLVTVLAPYPRSQSIQAAAVPTVFTQALQAQTDPTLPYLVTSHTINYHYGATVPDAPPVTTFSSAPPTWQNAYHVFSVGGAPVGYTRRLITRQLGSVFEEELDVIGAPTRPTDLALVLAARGSDAAIFAPLVQALAAMTPDQDVRVALIHPSTATEAVVTQFETGVFTTPAGLLAQLDQASSATADAALTPAIAVAHQLLATARPDARKRLLVVAGADGEATAGDETVTPATLPDPLRQPAPSVQSVTPLVSSLSPALRPVTTSLTLSTAPLLLHQLTTATGASPQPVTPGSLVTTATEALRDLTASLVDATVTVTLAPTFTRASMSQSSLQVAATGQVTAGAATRLTSSPTTAGQMTLGPFTLGAGQGIRLTTQIGFTPAANDRTFRLVGDAQVNTPEGVTLAFPEPAIRHPSPSQLIFQVVSDWQDVGNRWQTRPATLTFQVDQQGPAAVWQPVQTLPAPAGESAPVNLAAWADLELRQYRVHLPNAPPGYVTTPASAAVWYTGKAQKLAFTHTLLTVPITLTRQGPANQTTAGQALTLTRTQGGQPLTRTTDASGRVDFGDVPWGDYVVTAQPVTGSTPPPPLPLQVIATTTQAQLVVPPPLLRDTLKPFTLQLMLAQPAGARFALTTPTTTQPLTEAPLDNAQPGTYTLTELVPPTGFSPLAGAFTFTLDARGDITALAYSGDDLAPEDYRLTSTLSPGTAANQLTFTLAQRPSPATTLPATGSRALLWLVVATCALFGLAVLHERSLL
ncbi:collagen binding domain-containing protein [Lacticaseibacillus daqingensis]|uniref:hypothetical protein n=1 Tax=Lacticaseibacillus daqingensis TaxID=2486014 RepID=UPI000F775152|nr:hypothetical protein [Lacticaseibacillus daqingensis]